jgi:uncharacterized protein
MYYFDANANHVFEKNGRSFLLGTRNGSLLEVSDVASAILHKTFPQEHKSICNDLSFRFSQGSICDTISELLDWGILSKQPVKCENVQKRKNHLAFLDTREIILQGLFLTVQEDCNLRCNYCSAGFGQFGRNSQSKEMNPITVRKAIDFLHRHSDEKKSEMLICFVGGEPLMNFPAIKAGVEHARSLFGSRAKFMLNTNGTMMNEVYAKWFVQNEVMVRFSIDGTKEMHDANRIYPNGRGSYDDVMKGLICYRKFSPNFSVQASIAHGKNAAEAVHHLWQLGAKMVLSNPTSESPFLAESARFNMTSAEMQEFVRELDGLNMETAEDLIKSQEASFVSWGSLYLKRLHNKDVRSAGCGAGLSPCVTPDETIYPCQGFVGDSRYEIGKLENGLDLVRLARFGEELLEYQDKCGACWAMTVCGAPCLAQAVGYKDLSKESEPLRHCQMFRSFAECAIYAYNHIAEHNPKALEQLFQAV